MTIKALRITVSNASVASSQPVIASAEKRHHQGGKVQVINIRGTTGSGKTTLMRSFMAKHDWTQAITISEGVVGHFSKDYCVIGPYTSSKFGGVDAIKRIEYVIPAIWKALEKRPVVLFEGLLVSHSFQRWIDFSMALQAKQQSHREHPFGLHVALIVPPFRVNIQRLRKRNGLTKETFRATKGDAFITSFVQRYKSIVRIKEKFHQYNGNCTPINLDYKTPLETLIITLKGLDFGSTLKQQSRLKGFFK